MESPTLMAREDALEEAARCLEGTAADYEQMAERERASMRRPQGGALASGAGPDRRAQLYEANAQLLRGQAGHIRELKKK